MEDARVPKQVSVRGDFTVLIDIPCRLATSIKYTESCQTISKP
jgi:hypothetical protein